MYSEAMSNLGLSETQIESLRERVAAELPCLVQTLGKLVSFESVSSDPGKADELMASAQFLVKKFQMLGFDASIRTSTDADGNPGKPAVVASKKNFPGRPTVLLYAHHDVMPVGDTTGWLTEPLCATERDGRLYGRGTSDDGGGVVSHLGALRVLGDDLGVNVVVFIEGEEEIGSPTFKNFISENHDDLEADVIIVADSSVWTVDVPAITTTLRGNAIVDVKVKMLNHAAHSGAFGGPILDAVTASAHLIASLHDEAGDLAIPGLESGPDNPVEWDEDSFLADAGAVPSLELQGRGSLTTRLWSKPSIAVIGMNVRSIEESGNILAPECKFRLSMRTAPTQDAREAADMLAAYLDCQSPFGAEVNTKIVECGPGFKADENNADVQAMHRAMSQAWQTESVNIGQGGSIPFVYDFSKEFPKASVVVTGVHDMASNPHSENESMHLKVLENATLAEAIFLAELAQRS